MTKILLVLVFLVPVEAQTVYSCKVVSQDFDNEHSVVTAPIATNIYRVPFGSPSNVVVVETEAEQRLILSESFHSRHFPRILPRILQRKEQGPLVFDVGEQAQFTVQNSWLIFRDAAGEKHKFAIVKEDLIQ